ncbi:flagellar biosynthesis protein FlhG [Gammaproteobacteria bacterium]
MGNTSNLRNSSGTRTLCVTSGKGGVGKTTLSINLGIAMAAEGYRVLLMDGDMGLANVNVQMGIVPEYNILDVIKGRKTLAQIVCKTTYGIDFIAGGNGISQLANIGEAEQSAFMNGMENLAEYDMMIIDTAAGIGANVIRFVLAADDVVVVTTPEPTAMADAYGIIKTVFASQSKPIKFLVNRVASEQHALQVVNRLNKVIDRFMGLHFNILGHVPSDPLIEKSIFQQRPHLVGNPGSKSAILIRTAANRIIDPHYKTPTTGLSGFFQNIIKFTSDR